MATRNWNKLWQDAAEVIKKAEHQSSHPMVEAAAEALQVALTRLDNAAEVSRLQLHVAHLEKSLERTREQLEIREMSIEQEEESI